MSDPFAQPGANPLLTIISTLQQNGRAIQAIANAINSKFPDWVAVPATAASAGTAGQVAYDATHFYVCIATNTWVRCALATW